MADRATRLLDRLKSLVRRPPLTASLIFECIQDCNLTCAYCYNVWNKDKNYPRGLLSTNETKLLIAKALRQSRTRHVTFSGGEPYLREDLMDLLAYCKFVGAAMNMITNGTFLDRGIIDDTITRGVRMFEIQLPSADREITAKLMGGDFYGDIVRALANVKAAKGRVVAVIVCTKENVETLAETYRLLFALGVDGVMLNRMNPGGRGVFNMDRLMPWPAEFEEALDITVGAMEKYKLNVSVSIPVMPCLIDMKEKYPHIGTGFCAAGTERAYFTMDPLGNLRVCNHTSRILGNLRESSFGELAAEGRAFYKAKPSYCLACARVNECLGGCKAAAEECFGELTGMDPFLKAGVAERRAIKPPDMRAI
jgi:radical SAM protein with 4Fe4S-binding SPASM domain